MKATVKVAGLNEEQLVTNIKYNPQSKTMNVNVTDPRGGKRVTIDFKTIFMNATEAEREAYRKIMDAVEVAAINMHNGTIAEPITTENITQRAFEGLEIPDPVKALPGEEVKELQ